jgi:hypothetical protein
MGEFWLSASQDLPSLGVIFIEWSWYAESSILSIDGVKGVFVKVSLLVSLLEVRSQHMEAAACTARA